MRARIVHWLCVVVVCSLLPCSAAAQTIRGRIVDASTGAFVPNAHITIVADGRRAATAISDSMGTFVARLSGDGTYDLRVLALGYDSLTRATVVVGPNELVELTLRLSQSPIPLDPISVMGRRIDPRHLATYEGLYARREAARPVGPARVVLHTDPEMSSAIRVTDVLQWFPRPRGCIVYFVNGIERNALLWDVRDLSVAHLEGLEFYRTELDAPLEYRGVSCRAGGYSVVAIWLLRPGR